MEASPFEVLGVDRGAAWDQVRRTYRDLARRYHPDGTAPDPARMAAVNRAYERLERERRSWGASAPIAVGPGTTSAHPAPVIARGGLLERIRANAVPSPVIDFGEYAGWRIADVARVNPTYLRWLSRHSSGARYRGAIAEVLGDPAVGRRAAFVR
jgi:hypothetical protein